MLGYSLPLTMAKMKPQMLQKVCPDDKTLQTGFLPTEQALRGAAPEDISHFPDSGDISEEGILSQRLGLERASGNDLIQPEGFE